MIKNTWKGAQTHQQSVKYKLKWEISLFTIQNGNIEMNIKSTAAWDWEKQHAYKLLKET